jgi:hypothetical protein
MHGGEPGRKHCLPQYATVSLIIFLSRKAIKPFQDNEVEVEVEVEVEMRSEK